MDVLSFGLRSSLVIPLHEGGVLNGLLYIGAKTPDFITDDYIEIAREVAARVAIAIRQARSKNQLRDYAKDLEDRVAARTLELQAMVDALREQETQRRRMEERLHILFHLAPDPIVLFDKTWALRDMNHAYEVMTGYTRAELIGMNPVVAGLVMRVSAEVRQWVIDALTQGRPVDQYEVIIQPKTGARVEVEVNIHPVTIGGEPVFMAALRDISARKKTEAALRESMRALEEVNELRSRFVSVAAHQFRTPLATILVTTDNLGAYRHRMDDASIDGRLQKIRTEVSHMQRMINDLLHLAQIQSPGYVLKTELLDLDAECRAVVKRFHEDPDLAHMLVYTSSTQPVNALLDARLMRDAITSLISNALTYSPAGTTVSIALTTSDGQAMLSVSDQGIGIPASELPNLFQAFNRASNVNEVAGAGLGLSIAKNVVELHGGAITVKSEVGTGSTFTIALPR